MAASRLGSALVQPSGSALRMLCVLAYALGVRLTGRIRPVCARAAACPTRAISAPASDVSASQMRLVPDNADATHSQGEQNPRCRNLAPEFAHHDDTPT